MHPYEQSPRHTFRGKDRSRPAPRELQNDQMECCSFGSDIVIRDERTARQYPGLCPAMLKRCLRTDSSLDIPVGQEEQAVGQEEQAVGQEEQAGACACKVLHKDKYGIVKSKEMDEVSRAAILVSLFLERNFENLQDDAMKKIFLAGLTGWLKTFVSHAKENGVVITITPESTGILVVAEGHEKAIPQYTFEVLRHMSKFRMDESTYNHFKQQTIHYFRSASQNLAADDQAREHGLESIEVDFQHSEAMAQCATHTSFTRYQKFQEEIFNSMFYHLNGLNNIQQTSLLELGRSIPPLFRCRPFDMKPDFHCLTVVMEKGNHYLRNSNHNEKDQNSGLFIHFQVLDPDSQMLPLARVTEALIFDEFCNEPRTGRQLSCTTFVEVVSSHGCHGIEMDLNSSRYNPDYLLAQVDAIFLKFRTQIYERFTNDSWNEYVLEHWEHDEISRKDIIDFFNLALLPGPFTRRLISQVFASKHQYPGWKTNPDIDGNLIENPMIFKSLCSKFKPEKW